MKPYIFGKRNGIHIIDIRETVKGLLRSKKLLAAIVAQGQDVLIVGTKRQARDVVEKQASRAGMHYVSERWLGGTLTNFKTIRSRLARLEQLERLETTGEIGSYSKKMKSTLDRERRKIQRNLEGMRRMTRLPGVLAIIDVKREHIAIKEARKLGIPTIAVVDTDSDPTQADIVIPGNDDNMRAIDIIVTQWADAIEEGKRTRPPERPDGGEPSGEGPRRGGPRRSSRISPAQRGPAPMADEETPAAEAAPEEPARPDDESDASGAATQEPVEAGTGAGGPRRAGREIGG